MSTTGLGKVESDRPYAYDAADNLTQLPSGAVQAYDVANQLCSSTPVGVTWASCGANPPPNVTTFSYDANANRKSRVVAPATPLSTTTYRYDQARRLILVDAPDVGGVATSYAYTYDGDGLRTTRTTTLGTTTTTNAFVWDRSGSLPLLLAEDATSYVYGPAGLPLARVKAGAVLYYHHDQLGSTRVLTDATGNLAATYAFDSYGRPAGTFLSPGYSGLANPFGYAGEYTDAETGFQYLRARYYDPATGQFLTRDPIEAVTREPYGYVGGDPLNATDPSGLFAACGTQIDDTSYNSWTPEQQRMAVAGACAQAPPYSPTAAGAPSYGAPDYSPGAPNSRPGGTCGPLCQAAALLGPPIPPSWSGAGSSLGQYALGRAVPWLNLPLWGLTGVSGLASVLLGYQNPDPCDSPFKGSNVVQENGIPYAR